MGDEKVELVNGIELIGRYQMLERYNNYKVKIRNANVFLFIYCWLFLVLTFVTNTSTNNHYTSQSQVKDSSPVDVHTCNSLVCMACAKTRDIKFIEVPGEGTNNQDEKNEPVLPNTSAKHKKKKFIIENMSSIGVIRAFSTADAQKQDRDDKESLSDDKSVEKFIESIENGYRGFFWKNVRI